MSTGEKWFLLAIDLGAIVGLGLVPDDPKSKDILRLASPVDWSTVSTDPKRKITISRMGIPAYPGARADNFIERNLEERTHSCRSISSKAFYLEASRSKFLAFRSIQEGRRWNVCLSLCFTDWK